NIEGNEQFNFTIDNLTGDANLSAPRTATITIDDNDSVQANGDGLFAGVGERPGAVREAIVRDRFRQTDRLIVGDPLVAHGAEFVTILGQNQGFKGDLLPGIEPCTVGGLLHGDRGRLAKDIQCGL
ncbi:MAG: hypothetical protein AAFV53_34845, partial [Myxococcota bacterium]